MQIISHELLNGLEKNDEIKIIKKEQTGSMVGLNYFISPKLSIKLYKPKVIFVNPKTITFEMSKINTGLLGLLRRCDQIITDKIKTQDHEDSLDLDKKIKYGIFYENESNNTICLRCYLPAFKTKYLIKYIEEREEVPFKLPRSNSVIDEVIIDIKNVWVSGNKIGYNLELKIVNVY